MLLLPLLCTLCLCTMALESTPDSLQPRYTLLADSKRKDQLQDKDSTELSQNALQPWRRYGHQPTAWTASTPGALLSPGLLLLGVNLGALLYMLLGLLGLAPSQRPGAWSAADFYRNDRQESLSTGKETDMYF
ncbi:uncharacterized protein LOC108600075 [Drosophila busckii]|uniref:uncharacterized protein LOC108600075 n=1 Tax=Drosophila busckii TaxID=30019 RepID=UPI00083ED4D0|nr:uncharacterized protein LOC108600075 [Drosophila busckii]